MSEEFKDLIVQIGDQYFSINPEDAQSKNYPAEVIISDSEFETEIKIYAEGKNSIKEAEALVKILNGRFTKYD